MVLCSTRPSITYFMCDNKRDAKILKRILKMKVEVCPGIYATANVLWLIHKQQQPPKGPNSARCHPDTETFSLYQWPTLLQWRWWGIRPRCSNIKGKNINLGIGLAALCTSNFAYAFIPNLFGFCQTELESIIAFKVVNMFCWLIYSRVHFYSGWHQRLLINN